MKKLLFAVALVLASVFPRPASSDMSEFKLVVSAEPTEEIIALLNKYADFNKTGGRGISSKDDGVVDYVIGEFSKKSSETPEVTDGYILIAFKNLFDEQGSIVPGAVIPEPAGLVFVDEKLAWFVSEEAKNIFIKATK